MDVCTTIVLRVAGIKPSQDFWHPRIVEITGDFTEICFRRVELGSFFVIGVLKSDKNLCNCDGKLYVTVYDDRTFVLLCIIGGKLWQERD